jgi:uncharacterized protein YacL
MAEIEKEIEKLNIRGVILSAIFTAFGFIIALVWRDAIMATIELIKPSGQGLFYSYFTAIFVTIFVIVIAYILIKLNQRIEKLAKFKGR